MIFRRTDYRNYIIFDGGSYVYSTENLDFWVLEKEKNDRVRAVYFNAKKPSLELQEYEGSICLFKDLKIIYKKTILLCG